MSSFDTFEPVLLEAAGIDDGHTIESYRSRGGYAPLELEFIVSGESPCGGVSPVIRY